MIVPREYFLGSKFILDKLTFQDCFKKRIFGVIQFEFLKSMQILNVHNLTQE